MRLHESYALTCGGFFALKYFNSLVIKIACILFREKCPIYDASMLQESYIKKFTGRCLTKTPVICLFHILKGLRAI